MLRSSTELLRIDSASPIFADEDEELQRRQYVTSLSPRLQTAGSAGGGSSESQQQQRRSSGGGAASSSRIRIGAGQPLSSSSPTRESRLSTTSDPSDPNDAFSAAGKGTAYRRFEREVESLQQQRDASSPMGSNLTPYRPGGASPVAALAQGVSTTTSLPLHANSSSIDMASVDTAAPQPSTGQATPTNKRAKRVSLGQVSIDGVPFITIDSATTDSIGHSSLARPRASSGSRMRVGSGSSPASSRDGGDKSRRRRTMTDYNHRNSGVLSTLRERRLSDPTSALETSRIASGNPDSVEEGRRRVWLLDGGRSRQNGGSAERGRNRIIRSASSAHRSTSTDAQRNAQVLLHDFGSASNTNSPRLKATSIMRWDAAQSTALSLRHGNGSALPVHKLSNETGRYSTPSEVVSHNRLAAHRYLNALNALRARIPEQPSTSLRPLRYQSILARVHHRMLIFQSYLHVPATIFLDFNALFALVQIAKYPDANASSAAWWIASGVYGFSFAVWLIGVVVVWEGVVEYRRRWVSTRPFALPIYLSAPAFTLTAIQSFSLYSLLYRARFSATRRDFAVESFWLYGQNWPTVMTLIPRGVILAVVLVLYNATAGGASPTRQPLGGQERDPVYFASDTGLLTTYAFAVLIVNAAWMAWRVLVLLVAWTGLAIALGPRWMFRREAAYYQSDESDMSMSEMGHNAARRPLLNVSRMSDVATEYDVGAAALPQATEMAERRTADTRLSDGVHSHAALPSSVQPVTAPTQPQPTEEPTLHLPNWAWRQRAEERLNALLYQCHIMISEVDDGQRREVAPSPQQKRQYRASLPYDPEADVVVPRRGGSLDIAEQHRRKQAGNATASLPVVASAGDVLSASARQEAPLPTDTAIASSSSSSAVPTATSMAVDPTTQSQSALKEKTSDGGISTSSYPFPRRSQDTTAPSAAATVYTAARSSSMRNDSGVTSSVYSTAAGDATRSTPVLESSAMSREHRSNETVRQERASGSAITPAVPMQDERTTWWTGLWTGSRKRDSPSEGTSLKSLPATPPKEMPVSTQSELEPEPATRTDSPLSGMRTDRAAVQESSHEARETKGEEGHAIAGDIDDSSTGGHSATTEDSEERRIWAAFPEQSRRHPPGLIAVEMEQRRLERERQEQQRRRNSQPQRRWSNEDVDAPTMRITPPLPSTSSRQPPRYTTSLSVVEDESTDTHIADGSADESGGGDDDDGDGGGHGGAADTPYDPASSVLPGGSPAEGVTPLGMIQEESWSSGLATDDDEVERLRGSESPPQHRSR